MAVLGVRLDGHAARRARLLQLGAEGLHQLSELRFQVLGAGTVQRIAVLVRLAADVPLDLQKHLTGYLGANQRGEVQAFHLAGRQPRGRIGVHFVPQVEGVNHLIGQRRVDVLNRRHVLKGEHPVYHLPYKLP